MKEKYSNLKQKTVFDFTDDPKILLLFFPKCSKESDKKIMADYLLSPENEDENGFYLWSYAEIVHDMEMVKAIENQFDMRLIYGFDPD